MCLLILLRGFDPEYPLLVASNRDEQRDRKASPPGLWVGERRRVLSPRDRRAGGTWLGVNDRGMFAGLTNARGPQRAEAPSRGALPHLALDHDDAEAGAQAVAETVQQDGAYNPFQLLVHDARSLWRVAHDGEQTAREALRGPAVVVTNEHGPGELTLDLAEPTRAGLTVSQRLDALAPLLLDEGAQSGHPVLKKGDAYGTVSSALLAVPGGGAQGLVLRYAPGPPDEQHYRNYSNLARRLIESE